MSKWVRNSTTIRENGSNGHISEELIPPCGEGCARGNIVISHQTLLFQKWSRKAIEEVSTHLLISCGLTQTGSNNDVL